MARGGGNDRALVGVDVIELGLSSLLRLAHADRLARDELRRFAGGVAQISRNDRVLGTNDHAGRLEADFGTVRAEMTFRRGAIVGIHVNRIVGTGLHAGLAADAAVGVEIDDAVLALIHRRHGANRDARRLLAMIAARDLKYAARVGKQALLDVLDPGAIHAYGHLVLGFACHRAGVTADAFAIIDYEAVFHPWEV